MRAMPTHRPSITLLSTLLLTAAGCGGAGNTSTPADDQATTEETAPREPEPVAIVDGQLSVGDMTFDIRSAGPGDGELVLMLHGFPQTNHEWRHQQLALAEAGYRVVTPNQRGYSAGARPEGIEHYTLDLLVADIVGMVDTLGVERFHLVGHDWGAIVAWGVAAAVPDRLMSVTPISVPHLDAFARVLADPESCQPASSAYFDLFVQPDSEDGFLAENAAGLRGIYAGIEADAIEEFVRVLGSKPALGSALNWYRANIEDRQPTAPALGSISVPTMFVWSDGDTALCRDGAELTGEYVDGPYRFEILEGINHWIPDMAPDQLNALLLDHIGQYSER